MSRLLERVQDVLRLYWHDAKTELQQAYDAGTPAPQQSRDDLQYTLGKMQAEQHNLKQQLLLLQTDVAALQARIKHLLAQQDTATARAEVARLLDLEDAVASKTTALAELAEDCHALAQLLTPAEPNVTAAQQLAQLKREADIERRLAQLQQAAGDADV